MALKQVDKKPQSLKGIPKRRYEDLLCALEDFVGPNHQARTRGLGKLLALDAHRRSPLVATILADRISEVDLELRLTIVKALAMVLKPGVDGLGPSDNVNRWLCHNLGQMRTRDIYALLQVLANSMEYLEPVCCVMAACSFAGENLERIISDHKNDVSIRIAAAEAIGRIGFLDAEATLKALLRRLSDRKKDQTPLTPEVDQEVEALLPAIRKTLHILQEAKD